MRAPTAVLPLLALLAATPVLIPLSQGPIVTAVAELWALATAGMVALVLGLQAWREAPLQVAAFPTPDQRRSAWPELLVGTAGLAGLISALIGLMQVLTPQLLEGSLSHWVQATHLPGRAVGHVRQPNHLATVLLWGAVAWSVLHAQSMLKTPGAAAGLLILLTCLVLTGSRTGLLGLSCLVVWGLMDRRLPRATRALLALTPLMAAAGWFAAQAFIEAQGLPTGVSARLTTNAGGDISSSRFAIWRNTWTLIEQQPWAGVGWGHFNIAWSLTSMSPRPPAFFDHAHNLPLHILAEWGVPLGSLALLGLLVLLVQATRRTWAWPQPSGDTGGLNDALCRRGAWVMLAIVGLHSLLEYPLWYAYLGMPALLALLVCLGLDRPWQRAARWQALLLMTGGGVLVVLAAWAYSDYQRIRAIYEPGSRAGSLSHRITRGTQATWFADHAHYALATTVKPIPQQPWTEPMSRAFERAPHVLLDPRLMMAWADALASRNGPDDRDRARYIAARLREFSSPAAHAWLAACENPPAPEAQRFVCETPEKPWTWRDFTPRASTAP